MILPVQQARAAAQGRVTVAFIPVGKSRTVKRPKGRPSYESQPWIPRTGQPEPLQAKTGRKMPTVGHVVIIDHHEATLRHLLVQTEEALRLIRAAGFRTRADMADRWMCTYDRDWPPKTEALCGHCEGEAVLPDGEVCPDCDLGVVEVPADVDDQAILDRFEAHADTPVHVVRFYTVADDRPRFLAFAAQPRGDEKGYTVRADSLDAGSVVEPEVQRGFAKDARENRRTAASIATEHERAEIARLIASLERQSADSRVARELRHMRARLKRINALMADAA